MHFSFPVWTQIFLIRFRDTKRGRFRLRVNVDGAKSVVVVVVVVAITVLEDNFGFSLCRNFCVACLTVFLSVKIMKILSQQPAWRIGKRECVKSRGTSCVFSLNPVVSLVFLVRSLVRVVLSLLLKRS